MPHTAISYRDEHGHDLVQVSLSNSDRHAVLDARDYREVVKVLGTGSWRLSKVGRFSYVRTHDPRTQRPITITRVILGNPHKASIRCANGDPCDLRRSNLYMDIGCGGVRKRRRLPKCLSMTMSVEVHHV